jgi:hypothetical protein
MRRYRREFLCSLVGFLIPVLLWSATIFGFDPMTPPTLLIWPSMILMFVLIGNESYLTAVGWLLISALTNAAIYLVLVIIVIRLRSAWRSRHAEK